MIHSALYQYFFKRVTDVARIDEDLPIALGHNFNHPLLRSFKVSHVSLAAYLKRLALSSFFKYSFSFTYTLLARRSVGGGVKPWEECELKLGCFCTQFTPMS